MSEMDVKKAACDVIVERAAAMMVREVGAPVEMVVDRLATYVAAQMVALSSSAEAAQCLRRVADLVEGGVFDGVGEVGTPRQ